MVGTDCVADLRFLLVFLSELHTENCMRKLRILVRNFSDIMEQSGPLGGLWIETEL